MERLRPEEDPGRSALTSTSGKYAGESVEWGYILSRKYFLVFAIWHLKGDYSSQFLKGKHPAIKSVLVLKTILTIIASVS